MVSSKNLIGKGYAVAYLDEVLIFELLEGKIYGG